MTAWAIRIGIVGVLMLVNIDPAAAQANVYVSGRASVRVGPVRGRVVVRSNRGRVRYEPRRHRHTEYRRRTHRVRYGYESDAARFCRIGRAHPIYGWEPCVNGGWLRPYRRGRWVAAFDYGVTFRSGYDHHYGRHLRERELRHVIGRRAFERLHHHSHDVGAYGALSAGWIELEDGAVGLEVYAGGVPIAELRDQDRDAYVDVAFLYVD